MEELLVKDNIFILENKFKKNKDFFQFISSRAVKDNYANDEKKLVKAFIKREKEGTTGMENYIAIPHAITDSIIKAGIYICMFKSPIKWKTLDEKNFIKFAIVLLVPKSKRTKDHLSILSKTAEKLMDSKTIDILQKFDIDKVYEVFK